MSDFSYVDLNDCFKTLKLDITPAELAALATDHHFDPYQLDSVKNLLTAMVQSGQWVI